MVLIQVPAGENVIHQGALPQEGDCMYLLASGEVDIVIAGGGAQQTANEDRTVAFSWNWHFGIRKGELCVFKPYIQVLFALCRLSVI